MALFLLPAPARAADGMGSTLLAMDGVFLGAIALLLFLYGRHWRRNGLRQAEDAAALRLAYAELETAKRQAEAQAAQTNATLAAMSDGLMVLDPSLRLARWNDRFAEITGVPPSLLRVGTPMEALLRGQAEAGEFGPMPTPQALDAEVGRRMVLIRNFPVVGVTERVRPNGNALELRRARLPDGGLITLYTDITARKRAVAARRAAHEAEAANLVQQRRLVAMVSHEIRVPLDALLGSLALLDTAGLSDAPRGLVETARRAGATLRTLVTDILDLSRLEAGHFVLRPASFALAEPLADAVDLFHAPAATRGLTLQVEIAPELPPRLFADAARVRQIVMNLISNACKFSEPGMIAVRADRMGEELRISVIDPGPLIPPYQASRLFRPFERLEAAEDANVPGTGLGLAICARLVGLMGGRIGLEAEGGGNRFWFTVPLAAAPVPQHGVTEEEVAHRPVRRARILLVEDVIANRNLTAALLRRDGHRVDVAESGTVAVRMAASGGYDLVLMDIHMPGIDGVEAATRIRRLPPPAGSVPIVALTGSGEVSEAAARPGSLMAGVLTKPVSPDMLEATLRRILAPAMAASPARQAEPAHESPLDIARITGLRAGLAPRMFATLVEQCLADISLRLPALAAAVARDEPAEVEESAHALAGMAGSYGLAGLERRMRVMIDAARAQDGVLLTSLAADIEAEFARDAAALRQFLLGLEAAA